MSRRAKRDSGRKATGDTRTVGPELGSETLDGGVMISAVVLMSFGVVMSYSTTASMALDESIPPLFVDHVGALLAGICVAGLAFVIPPLWWRRLSLPMWALGVLLLALTAIFGVEVNGAQRWLDVPGAGFRFQPVELAKCATVLAVAAVVARRESHEELSTRRALVACGLALVPVVLLLIQPDLGNAVLLTALVALLLIVAGTKLIRLALPGLLVLGVFGIYVSQHDYALRRFIGFLDPWAHRLSEGFQLVQSFVAFGRGGLLGTGLGNGQQKLHYLPEAHTDFILSLVAEELGLVGVLLVLGAFAGLLVAGTRIATRARDRFALLVAFGMTALLTLPAVINASVVMGLLPTKGLTLPFLSYGRTSLIVCCATLGILLGFARSAGARSEPVRVGGARRWR